MFSVYLKNKYDRFIDAYSYLSNSEYFNIENVGENMITIHVNDEVINNTASTFITKYNLKCRLAHGYDIEAFKNYIALYVLSLVSNKSDKSIESLKDYCTYMCVSENKSLRVLLDIYNENIYSNKCFYIIDYLTTTLDFVNVIFSDMPHNDLLFKYLQKGNTLFKFKTVAEMNTELLNIYKELSR